VARLPLACDKSAHLPAPRSALETFPLLGIPGTSSDSTHSTMNETRTHKHAHRGAPARSSAGWSSSENEVSNPLSEWYWLALGSITQLHLPRRCVEELCHQKSQLWYHIPSPRPRPLHYLLSLSGITRSAWIPTSLFLVPAIVCPGSRSVTCSLPAHRRACWGVSHIWVHRCIFFRITCYRFASDGILCMKHAWRFLPSS
jgi:hypothetical protein